MKKKQDVRPMRAVALGALLIAVASQATAQPTPAQPAVQPAAAAMKVSIDIDIPTSDGAKLKANLFLPQGEGSFPVILAMGPYGKDVHFADAYPDEWKDLNQAQPDICKKSSCDWMRWELPDPERWTAFGYAVVAVDARGSGKTPGFLDHYSPRETQDLYDSIEWAGVQPWSTGQIGLLGISYLATNQWQVAALRPPHLAAIVPWEGAADMYRDVTHHGGIFSNVFGKLWTARQIVPNLNGNAATRFKDRATGERNTGDPISPALLPYAFRDTHNVAKERPLDDAAYREISADVARITVPVLSAGNWGGAGMHLRGNVEAYLAAGSKDKWLEIHNGSHYEHFYSEYGLDLQRRFFDHFLKGADNGWAATPPVLLNVRTPGGEVARTESAWPLPETQWTRYHLDAKGNTLTTGQMRGEARVTYNGLTGSAAFSTGALPRETEITGPVSARLWVSSSTADLDLFAVLRAYDPAGKEITFRAAIEPAAPLAQGWLRASRRKTDPARSHDHRPWHTHDEPQPLEPGKPYAIDVEIWPTSIVLPKGYSLTLTVQGADFTRAGATGFFKGSGPFLHNDPEDRPPAIFGGENTILTGGQFDSYLLLPVIPK